MPWFICDNCGESIKKPKVAAHANQCGSNSFTCLDCSRTFDGWSVASHSTCVTEHEKYAQGATKPGGYAAKGCFSDAVVGQASPQPAGEPTGLDFLSNRAPWTCSVCNVTCTSRETLAGHASGAKHRRRARAALAAAATSDGAKDAEQRDADKVSPAKEPQQTPSTDTKKKREREEDTTAAAAKPKMSKNAVDVKSKTKWKKLACAELAKKGGSMKLKHLIAAVLEAAGKGEEARAELLQKLESSGRFKLDGKRISLVSEN